MGKEEKEMERKDGGQIPRNMDTTKRDEKGRSDGVFTGKRPGDVR